MPAKSLKKLMSLNEYQYEDSEKADGYCYSGTNVLRNKLNILNFQDLHEVERQITAIKIAELERHAIKGEFDLPHLKNIHKFIFEDIYDFAGQIRNGDFLMKGNSIFCRALYIDKYSNEIYLKLKSESFLNGLKEFQLVERLAYYMGEINALHPFREGNGRVQRLFFKFLCANAGYSLSYHKTTKETLIQADIEAFNGNYEPMISVIKTIISKK